MESDWTYEQVVHEVMRLLNQGFKIVGQEQDGVFRAYVNQYKKIPVFGVRMSCCYKCAFNSAFEQVY